MRVIVEEEEVVREGDTVARLHGLDGVRDVAVERDICESPVGSGRRKFRRGVECSRRPSVLESEGAARVRCREYDDEGSDHMGLEERPRSYDAHVILFQSTNIKSLTNHRR
jgi:hypothetical protein